ncbi:MAG: MoaA/NifB/PqqE/SkfB family radical SAM enzyme [Chlamydiales bacterium]|jgi:MoaA/NifB/PqqE/SkfB family radical SAM enzyme
MTSITNLVHSAKDVGRKAFFALLPVPLLNLYLRKRLPRMMNLEATTACNLECPLCSTHILDRRTRYLKAEHMDSIIDSCTGLKMVCFHIMGEPLLHPQLFDFVKRCTERGVETHFGTNALILDEKIDEMLDSGLTSVSVAIDGADEEDYQKYRKRGSFDKAVDGTKKLLRKRAERGLKKPIIQVQTIMFSYNEEREDDVLVMLNGIGADSIALKRPSYYHDYEEWKVDNASVGEAKLARTIKNTDKFLAQVDWQDDTRKYTRPQDESSTTLYRNQKMCPQMEKGTVLCDGSVVACCMDAQGKTTFGNLSQDSFADIWRGEAHKKVIAEFQARTLSVCQSCSMRD